jgi:hypothetical protein
VFLALAALAAPSILPAQAAPPAREAGWLSRENAREDLFQLRTLLETSHPDPYLRAGGMVAFRRRFSLAEGGIPPEGIGHAAFLAILEPLVAQVRDAHTGLWDETTERGAPVQVDLVPVDSRLVVTRVYGETQKLALGATLESVEGIPVADLLERMARRRGYENLYSNLTHLAQALENVASLEKLLGRPLLSGQVRCRVRRPDGTSMPLVLPSGDTEPAGRLVPARRMTLPAPDVAGLATGFLDPGGKVAYFAMTSSMRYREAFEAWRAYGDGNDRGLEALVGPEGSAADKLARLPSVTERLESLVTEMKARKTPLLIVDLRRNQGGNSCFAAILAYFLYPLDQVASPRMDGYQVIRYSALYFQNRPNESLERVRARRSPTFQVGDLDFQEEEAWKASPPGPASPSVQAAWLKETSGGLPTFSKAVAEGRWNAAWRPKVVVLTSAATFSAGFDAVLQLHLLGAEVVGVPSSQAANCFIDTLPFQLKNSGIHGGMSFKWSVGLPDDPAAGELLHPDRELTYETFRDLRFDPDSSLILALRAEGLPEPAGAPGGATP